LLVKGEDMSIKRTTKRFKQIEEALEHIDAVENLTKRLDHLKLLVGATPCALCGKDAGLGAFCFGCLDFICETCQPPEPGAAPAGPHTLDDHREVAAQVGVSGFGASPSLAKS
jgi:hypothetical protein